MIPDVKLLFCTYFKKIEQFRYAQETYGEYVMFCVRQGAFSYQIGENKEEILSEGELVICPPNTSFRRKIIDATELCMIKFTLDTPFTPSNEKIKVSNILRWNDDLARLEGCLFCDSLSEHPEWSHYCMDIIYIAIDSIRDDAKLGAAKQFMDQNYDKKLCITSIAQKCGYTPPHFINKFKFYYGVSPKAYLSRLKVQKAKELLLMSDKLSRQIAAELGFDDELYFIRFFKKHTGLTPKQFKKRRLL